MAIMRVENILVEAAETLAIEVGALAEASSAEASSFEASSTEIETAKALAAEVLATEVEAPTRVLAAEALENRVLAVVCQVESQG